MFFSSCLLLTCPGGDQWALPLWVQLKVACSLEQRAEQLGQGVQKEEAFQTQAYLLLGVWVFRHWAHGWWRRGM